MRHETAGPRRGVLYARTWAGQRITGQGGRPVRLPPPGRRKGEKNSQPPLPRPPSPRRGAVCQWRWRPRNGSALSPRDPRGSQEGGSRTREEEKGASASPPVTPSPMEGIEEEKVPTRRDHNQVEPSEEDERPVRAKKGKKGAR